MSLDLDLSQLKGKKNLLAFSAGVDSSALFHLLLEHNITFDIALINYQTRQNSEKEEQHAIALAKEYGLQVHTTKAPTFSSNFEKNARDFRYNFFESLIGTHQYHNLLTAHQLNDQVEWLLMRLTKGAGTSELIGLEPYSKKEGYTLIRPLLDYSKEELLQYLQSHKHTYFVDESNFDSKYERSQFRHEYANALVHSHKEGLKRSLSYLRKDKQYLEQSFHTLYSKKALRVIQLDSVEQKAKAVDVNLKKLGYLLSASQREEILQEDSLVVGGMWAVEYQNKKLYIAPFSKEVMDKTFKERCRLLKVPSKIRAYCYKENVDLDSVMSHH